MATTSLYTPRHSGENVEVLSLAPDDITHDLALAVGGLIATAYHRQLDTVLPGIPRILFDEKYLGPEDEREEFAEERMDDMLAELERGGSYSVVYEDDELISYAEVIRVGPAEVQIANIATSPDHWGSSLGTCTLHAALSHINEQGSATLSLKAFRGSSVNSWYERIGFESTETDFASPQLYSIGEYKIPLVHYAGVSLGDVKTQLEYRSGPSRQLL